MVNPAVDTTYLGRLLVAASHLTVAFVATAALEWQLVVRLHTVVA